MTGINTNVSSPFAQKTLAGTNVDLQTALTRLSTGLRINNGLDNPGGLIASEGLRSDIVSVEKAITDCERANQLIATVDGALRQVSDLVQKIRGLVIEAANMGAMSEDQLAANQLQIDSSLETINRIALTTSFQGRKLLDGSLDFVTSAGTGSAYISDLQIHQAKLGATGSVAIDIYVATPATQAQLTTTVNNSVPANDTDGVAGLEAALVFELRGSRGSEVFNFAEGTDAGDVVAAIELVKDATGVGASYHAGTNTLSFTSVDYGADASVEVDVISETGTAKTFSNNLASAAGTATRDIGQDIIATVNGITAAGDGNTLSINTATLDLTAAIAAGRKGSMKFTISGGRALPQIGPAVAGDPHARIGIGSVHNASLGGVSGRLSQLGSGETADLDTDATTALQIVDEVGTKLAGLRGRLGAFQKTTLEANIFTLNETLANLTEAESTIRNAEFATETAARTRAQILVQSGMSVLSIANSNPQNVLALLQ